MGNISFFDWDEYNTAGTQVLPVVVGPEIPHFPMSDQEMIEMAAYECLCKDMVENRKRSNVSGAERY